MMITEKIGEAAGQIWHELEENGELSIAKIRTRLGFDVFTAQAAIGWLAREDKIEIKKTGNSLKASLKEATYA